MCLCAVTTVGQHCADKRSVCESNASTYDDRQVVQPVAGISSLSTTFAKATPIHCDHFQERIAYAYRSMRHQTTHLIVENICFPVVSAKRHRPVSKLTRLDGLVPQNCYIAVPRITADTAPSKRNAFIRSLKNLEKVSAIGPE